MTTMKSGWARTSIANAAAATPSRGILRDLLLFVALGAGLLVAHWLTRLIVALLLAVLCAYVLAPLVDAVQRVRFLPRRSRQLSRGQAIAAVYAGLAGSVAAVAILLWPSAARQLDEAIVRAPQYAESIGVWTRGWTRYYAHLRISSELRHTLDQSVLGAGDVVLGYASGALVAVITALTAVPWLLLVPILAFFLLKDAAAIRRTVSRALPYRIQVRGHRLFEELNGTLAAYARAQVIACLIVGLLCAVGFALLGTPYAILFGVLAAVLEFIPLLGPLAVAAVAVGVTAMQSPMLALWTAIFLVVLRIVQDM